MLKMVIEDLMKQVNRHNQTLERDIQVVQTYFGLGDQAYPTGDSVAQAFDVGSRERVRQIKTNKFVNRIKKDDFTILQSINEMIEQKEIHFVDDIIQTLFEKKQCDKEVHIKGLLNLLQAFGYCEEFQLYNFTITQATEAEIVGKSKLLLMKQNSQPKFAEQIRILRTFPGRHGMVNFLEVVSKNKWRLDQEEALYQLIIEQSEGVKLFTDNHHNMWYMFEESSNVIINGLGKIAYVAKEVNVDILAETIHSDIKKRSFQKSIPSVEMIKQYIHHSSKIEVTGDYAKILVEKKELNDIEVDILNFLEQQDNCVSNYSALNGYLESKGHKEAHRKKKLFSCPFVFVDKTNGRGNYRFVLINQFKPKQESTYEKYRNLLIKLRGNTDVSREKRMRNEQTLLRDWLFKGKEKEECAICGRTFSCASLVAAHKKKRAHCTEDERTDPNIVMPVCLFGCDHLYEHGYTFIKEGQVHTQHTDCLQPIEQEFLTAIQNRLVDKRWLQGSYFDGKS